MKRKLLLRAAELLAQIPKRQFSLDSWIQGEGADKLKNGEKLTKTKALSCGTLACAGGWLGVTKEFNEKGLTFKCIEHTSIWQEKWFSVELIHSDPKAPEGYTDLEDFDGLARLFDISYHDAIALFSYAGGSIYDNAIYEKRGYDLDDRALFQYRVKKLINNAKKGK